MPQLAACCMRDLLGYFRIEFLRTAGGARMSDAKPTVFILDDVSVRESLKLLIESAG
jgi:hypothetical protein